MKFPTCANCHSSKLTFIEIIRRWNCRRCGSWFAKDLTKITHAEVGRLFESARKVAEEEQGKNGTT